MEYEEHLKDFLKQDRNRTKIMYKVFTENTDVTFLDVYKTLADLMEFFNISIENLENALYGKSALVKFQKVLAKRLSEYSSDVLYAEDVFQFCNKILWSLEKEGREFCKEIGADFIDFGNFICIELNKKLTIEWVHSPDFYEKHPEVKGMDEEEIPYYPPEYHDRSVSIAWLNENNILASLVDDYRRMELGIETTRQEEEMKRYNNYRIPL